MIWFWFWLGVYFAGGLVAARVGATMEMKDVEEARQERFERYGNDYRHPGKSRTLPGELFTDSERRDIKSGALLIGAIWPGALVVVGLTALAELIGKIVLPKQVTTTAQMKKQNEDDIATLEKKLAEAKAKARKVAEDLNLPWPGAEDK